MKKYNISNYVRYKEDIKKSMPVEKFYDYYTRDEMVIKFLPLVKTWLESLQQVNKHLEY